MENRSTAKAPHVPPGRGSFAAAAAAPIAETELAQAVLQYCVNDTPAFGHEPKWAATAILADAHGLTKLLSQAYEDAEATAFTASRGHSDLQNLAPNFTAATLRSIGHLIALASLMAEGS